MYKNLLIPFADKSWESNQDGWNGYCLWGSMFAPDQGVGKSDYCAGHYEDDTTAFEVVAVSDNAMIQKSLSEGPLELVSRQMTNMQVMGLLESVNTQYLPYVYHDFNWTHCEELGFDFPASH